MYDLIPIEIAGTAMSAQRARMGVLASNMANAHSTRSADGTGLYQRRLLVLRAGIMPAFEEMLVEARRQQGGLFIEPDPSRWLVEEHLRGVEIARIEQDPATRRVYAPSHPDADSDGYVTYPDIKIIEEMTDLVSASRNYEANLAVVKNTHDMVMRLLDLLKT